MPRKDVIRPIKPSEEIKNGSITVATSEASFQNVDPDVNQHVASGDIVSGNTDRFDNINYYAQDGKLIPIVGQTPAAAYSIRALSGKTNASVVRLRRESDDAERDFSAGDLIFSESADLGANGGFDTDTDWTKGDGWSITGGQAVCDGTNVARSFLLQNGVYPTPTPWIKITFTIVACSDFDNAGFYAAATSLSKFSTRQITAPGTYSFILDRSDGGTANYRFYAEAGVTLTIDDASIVVYTPSEAELWALENTVVQGSRLVQESAYVTTWYDQSGNGNHATQATTADQPLLILAGVTNTENGKPALSFDGVNDEFDINSKVGGVSDYSAFAISNLTFDGNAFILRRFGGPNPQNILSGMDKLYNDGTSWRGAGGELGLGYQNIATWLLLGSNNNSGYSNGVVVESSVPGGQTEFDGAAGTLTLGAGGSGSNFITGNLQEFIIYASDQSANRTKIEKSINDYYNIYAYPDKPLISDTNPEAAAAYSLRNLTDYPTETPVVRVRRGSDDAERDFKPMDIVAGTSGAELVTNGGFDTDSDWNKGTGWTISGGQASLDGTQTSYSALEQTGVMSEGVYVLSFDVTSNNYGQLYFQWSSNAVQLSAIEITSDGSYKLYVDTRGSLNQSWKFKFYSATNGNTATLDNVSLKEYTPTTAELWAIQSATAAGVQFGKQATDSAYVTTWYDQSGNGNHATQATQADQPKLITAGVMNTENGKPAIVFDGTTTLSNDNYTGSARTDSFFVMQTSDDKFYAPSNRAASVSNAAYLADSSSINATIIGNGYNSGGNQLFVNGSEAVVSTRQDVQNALATGSQILRSDIDATTAAWTAMAWGAEYTTAEFEGSLQEWIIYNTDQSAKRISIENQINSYYGIY